MFGTTYQIVAMAGSGGSTLAASDHLMELFTVAWGLAFLGVYLLITSLLRVQKGRVRIVLRAATLFVVPALAALTTAVPGGFHAIHCCEDPGFVLSFTGSMAVLTLAAVPLALRWRSWLPRQKLLHAGVVVLITLWSAVLGSGTAALARLSPADLEGELRLVRTLVLACELAGSAMAAIVLADCTRPPTAAAKESEEGKPNPLEQRTTAHESLPDIVTPKEV